MEYVYAAMILHKAGKKVDEASMDAVLKAAGVTVDSARIKATVAALSGVDIDDVIKNAVMAVPASAPAGASEGGEAKAEAKAEPEEDKGKTEEEAAAGLGALFG